MSNQLGPIDVCCDSPSYTIVQACQLLDFQTPLDVRWYRMSHFLSEKRQMSGMRIWNLFFNKNVSEIVVCTCGEKLPVLENYSFTFSCGKVVHYLLGQCTKCKTIFWEDGLLTI